MPACRILRTSRSSSAMSLGSQPFRAGPIVWTGSMITIEPVVWATTACRKQGTLTKTAANTNHVPGCRPSHHISTRHMKRVLNRPAMKGLVIGGRLTNVTSPALFHASDLCASESDFGRVWAVRFKPPGKARQMSTPGGHERCHSYRDSGDLKAPIPTSFRRQGYHVTKIPVQPEPERGVHICCHANLAMDLNGKPNHTEDGQRARDAVLNSCKPEKWSAS